jgi:Arc/MetJ family transcription regulator
MRTNLDIDDDLMKQAMRASGLPTKKATVEAALRDLVQRQRRREAIANLAGIGWEGDLDQMREERFGDWGK